MSTPDDEAHDADYWRTIDQSGARRAAEERAKQLAYRFPKETIMSLATAPAPATAVPPDPKAQAKIDAIAKILGSDPTDTEALKAAFSALVAPVATARARALKTMSPREIAMCRERKTDVVKYVAMRDAIKAKRVVG